MSELRKLGEGEKFSHATVGAINGFNGKVFIKDELKETSCEISFGTLEPGQAVPFFHSHKANEENYIILSGEGSFQVNSYLFSIAEGSIIRVATNCDRNLRNTSETASLVYICIQAKEGSLDGYTMTDAVITGRESLL